MAEGLLRHMAGDQFEVFSAGTRPVGLNPNAVTAMSEIGINIAGSRSKSADEFTGQQFDYVITVCDNAKESCVVQNRPRFVLRRVDWEVLDGRRVRTNV